jgi:AcrR family transcriptional regulator
VIALTELFSAHQYALTEWSVIMSHTSARINDKASPHAGTQASKTQRQEAILTAAFEEFAARGYAEARLEDIAQRAGIAKGTIYLYFENKELLFRAVLRSLIHHVFQEVENFVQTFSGSAEELVRCVLSRQYAEVVGNPKARAMFRLLISESHKIHQLSDIYFREIITPGLRVLSALVQKGIASGEFRETKIGDFPQVLVGPAVLAVVWTLILGEQQRLDLEAYREAHLELLLHGLGKEKAGAARDCPREPGEREAQ